MKIGIIGSRRRNSMEDFKGLKGVFSSVLVKEFSLSLEDIDIVDSLLKEVIIVTGDCDKGGDLFAKVLSVMYNCNLDVKKIRNPETGEDMDFNNHPYFDYFTMCKIFYERDERIVKEDLDYLLALVSEDRTGGTEKTIEYFKQYHKDWVDKLIIL